MKIHSILLAVLFALAISVSALGQSTISIGTSHTLFSQILNEERTYWIYEPEGYSPEDSKSYPVLYLLDGDSFFHSVVGFTRFFASSRISNLPPCIVVAVLNTDRTRDFTPTSSAARRDGTLSVKDQPQGGGAEQFYRFITEELRLEVEKKTSSNRPHFLVGHSYAGLFTLHTLLNHPESFDSYIAIDPSLWWDQGVILTEAQQKVFNRDFSQKQLYVAFATKQRPEAKLVQFSLADSLKEKVIPAMEKQHLQVVCRKFPEEVHGTVALPGIFDGLKSLFRH